MEKLKKSISKTIQDLGESLNSNDDDVRMDDMSDYILSPYVGSNSMDGSVTHIIQKKKTNIVRSDVASDQEVMDSIDAAYFIEDDFDAIDYELKKQFDCEVYLEDLDRERMRLKHQLQVVSKRISILIMEKSPSYNRQLSEIDNIRTDLSVLIGDVSTIRSELALEKRRSKTCLAILANEKKKRLLRRLLFTLQTIKTLHETEYQIKEAIEDGHFPLAIRICIEAKEAATTYKYFSSISDLMAKLADTTNLIEKELDKALSSLTVVFDMDKYTNVHSAYAMLNKTEYACRALVKSFVTTIERTCRSMITEKITTLVDLTEHTFEDLCELLPVSSVEATIRELCFVLCKILTTYHYILRYHSEESIEDNIEEEECYKILKDSLSAVFRSALNSFDTLLSTLDFSTFKFDSVLYVVDLSNRFRAFGKKYFLDNSDELAVTLQRQTLYYFKRYHSERIEELKMFLENECFTLCPIPNQFTIFDLQDFQFLKENRQASSNSNCDVDDNKKDLTLIPTDFINPFGKEEVKSRTASVVSGPSMDTDDFSKEDLVDEPEDASINLCNTALNLLRFFGRYIRMTSLLPSISQYSLPAVTQLFEFFLYSISTFFGNDGSHICEVPAQLTTVLSIIKDRLIDKDYGENEGIILTSPQLSSMISSSSENLYAAAERIVAIDSVEFVARQLDLVRPVIEGLVSQEESELAKILEMFYAQVISVAPLTRKLIVDNLASKALDFSSLTKQISSQKWDINDLRSQHSPYIDFLLLEFENFDRKVRSMNKELHLSKEIRDYLWTRTIYYSFKAIVQGFCESGKCSTEGRALMQLDFQHLLIKLELVSYIKPIPHTEYVDGYIKAFYLPESGLEQWISQHKEYTSKQIISLLGVTSHVSKKAKSRIITALNE
ncbi:unnamed protein product [Auanema sp. JU1783]|nr:unnamed protein product [Auanema sp. JU1783]